MAVVPVMAVLTICGSSQGRDWEGRVCCADGGLGTRQNTRGIVQVEVRQTATSLTANILLIIRLS